MRSLSNIVLQFLSSWFIAFVIEICSNERCICNFECGGKAGKKAPKRDCNASTGPCSKECGDSCCNNKCASKYNIGVGYCRSLFLPLAMCQCVYAC
uniref:Defensin-like protein n=1 Tax=Medicago truncatula TaxID=3880 RepID=Q2HS02_MEDTR|nr:hypothetical protein MtrDRAFT_AC157504g5v2 [Medicago truncatula]